MWELSGALSGIGGNHTFCADACFCGLGFVARFEIHKSRLLMSESSKKVCVGYDGPDSQKMQNCFNLQPLGIVDIAEIAKQKGLTHTGLKGICEHFDINIKKDRRISCSNWSFQVWIPQPSFCYPRQRNLSHLQSYKVIFCEIPSFTHSTWKRFLLSWGFWGQKISSQLCNGLSVNYFRWKLWLGDKDLRCLFS